jgi:hypothetical protein
MANETQKTQPSWPHAAVQQISEYLNEMQLHEILNTPELEPDDEADKKAAWDEVYEEFLTKLQINV